MFSRGGAGHRQLNSSKNRAWNDPVQLSDEPKDHQKQHTNSHEYARNTDLDPRHRPRYRQRGDSLHRLNRNRNAEQKSAHYVHKPREDEDGRSIHPDKHNQANDYRYERTNISECTGRLPE